MRPASPRTFLSIRSCAPTYAHAHSRSHTWCGQPTSNPQLGSRASLGCEAAVFFFFFLAASQNSPERQKAGNSEQSLRQLRHLSQGYSRGANP